MIVIPSAKLLSTVQVCSQGHGGIPAFWNISSKESVVARGLKHRSCSPVWLLNVLMFLLSAILNSILAVSVMRNMLGLCYFYHFLIALIVPQRSWGKATFSCRKEGKKHSFETQKQAWGRRSWDSSSLWKMQISRQKIIPVAGLSRVTACMHTRTRTPTGHVLLCVLAPFLQVGGCSCWLGGTWSPWSYDSARLTICTTTKPLRTAWPRNLAEVTSTMNANCLCAEGVAGGWGHREMGSSDGASKNLSPRLLPRSQSHTAASA